MASVPRSPVVAPPLVDSLGICAWPDVGDLVRTSIEISPMMEFMIDFLCQITETEPKTAMAGPARRIPQRTWRNKPTNYHQPGSRWTWFCDNNLGNQGAFSQLYFRRYSIGGAVEQNS